MNQKFIGLLQGSFVLRATCELEKGSQRPGVGHAEWHLGGFLKVDVLPADGSRDSTQFGQNSAAPARSYYWERAGQRLAILVV